MVFKRRWSRETRDYIIDRTITGPLPTPETGQAQNVDGIIVGDSAFDVIPPATPVRVNLPGPNEPLVDQNGVMTPRWRRFFEELLRRTGQTKDNINDTDRAIGNSTTGATNFASERPTVTVA